VIIGELLSQDERGLKSGERAQIVPGKRETRGSFSPMRPRRREYFTTRGGSQTQEKKGKSKGDEQESGKERSIS